MRELRWAGGRLVAQAGGFSDRDRAGASKLGRKAQARAYGMVEILVALARGFVRAAILGVVGPL